MAAKAWPQTVAYCHCADCRRLSGAPVSAFAAFAPSDLWFDPPLANSASAAPGATRWFCGGCGSSLAARYAYLPDQIYVPIGLFDQAAALTPDLHAHAGSALPWLHLADDLPRADATARATLNNRAQGACDES